jgi:hypothetical protein
MTSMHHYARLLVEKGSHWLCLGWPQTMILPISASQIPSITGMSHWHSAVIPLNVSKKTFFLFQH